jgi:hypothetical protein
VILHPDQYARPVRFRGRLHTAVRSLRELSDVARLRSDLDAFRAQVGGLHARFVQGLPPDRLSDAEFQVFSQFGEDGIIQFLINHVPIEHEVFIEFGVQSYAESNTRFLLVHDNWHGLIIDGGDSHIDFTQRLGLDWQYHLDAVQAFIDRDNINHLIRAAGIEGDIGLLSVDIDGNDYWVLERIDAVSPRIVVVEYNSVWGPDAAVTVPYRADFRRAMAHPSQLYWGASLMALTRLLRRRRYALVGGNRAGNNAFYVRDDVLGDLAAQPVAGVYRRSRFRESLDPEGRRTYVSRHEDRLALLADMPLWDLDANALVSVGERYGAGADTASGGRDARSARR